MCSDHPRGHDRRDRTIRRGIVSVAAGLCATLTLATTAACASPAALEETGSAPRVTLDGGALRLDGTPWWPTGFDAYQLATNWSINAGCGAQTDLDAYFSSLPPRSLTRFDAFRSFAVDKHTGGLDYSPIDAVFAAAERHDQLLIPVLTAQDGACEDGRYKQRSWYTDQWRGADTGADSGESFSRWVETAVGRWSSSPSIAAWELIGEPETAVCAEDSCALESRTCPADSADVLRTWVDEAGALVRRLDPGRLVTVGLLGGDQCGTAGDGYAKVAESRGIDMVQYHDYDDARFLPGRLAEVEKPLLVAELGIRAGSCLDVAERARRIDARFDDYRRLGAAGALVWNYVPDPRPQECTYDVGPGDPIFDVIGKARGEA